MKIKLLRITIIILFAISFIQANSLQEEVNKLSNSKILKHSTWSVYAEYTKTGRPIIEYNSEISVAPASCQKVITLAMASYYLGGDFTYKTHIYYDGNITQNGILNGNIYIVGSGDPTLGSSDFIDSLPLDKLMISWVGAIKEFGIKKINGRVISDDLLFEEQAIPDDWNWTDIGNYYGAGTNSLCINDNLYFLYFRPNSRVGGEAKVLRTEPEIENLKFTNYMKTGKKDSGDNGYIFCAPKQFNAILRGTIPQGKSEFSIKGSMPDPALFASQYLTKCLEGDGIGVKYSAEKIGKTKKYDYTKLIHTTKSEPMSKIMEITNKRSVNLYTEQLLKTVAYKLRGEGSWDVGIDIIENFFKKNNVDISAMHLTDGSGLSRTNQITTKILAKLLSIMSKQKNFQIYYDSFGVVGDKNDIGYVKKFCLNTSAQYNARVKTGYINGVKSHTGYLHTKSGKLVSFSLIVNNYHCSNSDINELHETVVEMLADLE